jgi:hypothetical protein
MSLPAVKVMPAAGFVAWAMKNGAVDEARADE